METPMSSLTKLALLVVALNAFLASVSLIFLPGQTSTFFFWRITPPINAAILGTLYLGGAAALVHAVHRRNWETARYLMPVLIWLGVALTAITLLHVDKFAPGPPLAYWLAFYVAAPLIAIAVYLTYERKGSNWSQSGVPVKTETRILAGALAIILTVYGVVGFVSPEFLAGAYPWPISPLMVRVLVAWFSAFVPAFALFVFERDWNRLYPVANLMLSAVLLHLLIIAIHRGDITGSGSAVLAYIVPLVVFALLALAMHWIQRGRRTGAGRQNA